MIKPLAILLMTSLVTLAGLGQGVPQATKPAKFLWTEYVTIAEGKAATYPAIAVQARRAAELAKVEIYWIAASNMTGDMRQITYLSFYDNFASIEKGMAAISAMGEQAVRNNPRFAAESGQHVLAPRSTIAAYREDLSYMPEKVPVAAAKYWAITTIFLKAGRMSDYADEIKEEIELLKRAGLDHQFLTYQVVAGLPSSGSVFYIMVPMRTLADMDKDESEKAKTVFTATVRRRFETNNQKMIDHVASDILVVRPALSRPPASYISANPEFWNVNPQLEPNATGGGKQ